MEYEVVKEIANRANSIADSFFSAYDSFFSQSSMTRLEIDELLNILYHVVHAADLLSQDDDVAQSKKAPFESGASIIISSEILASTAADAAEILRSIVHKVVAKSEENYRYTKFAYTKDKKMLNKKRDSLASYQAIVQRDYLSYTISAVFPHYGEPLHIEMEPQGQDLEEQDDTESPTLFDFVNKNDLNDFDEDADSLVLVVYEDIIRASNITFSKSLFTKLDDEMPFRFRNRVSIYVDWNKEDSRELYDIPEVRAYFETLFNEVDSIFYWIDPSCDFFQILGFLLFPPKTRYRFIASKTVYVEPDNFALYINMGFDKLNRFCEEKGISEEPSSKAIYDRITELFPDPPDN